MMMWKRIGLSAALIGTGGVSGWYWYRQQHLLPPKEAALQQGKALSCRLSSVVKLNSNSARYRFELPTKDHVLGLPVASHILAVDAANVYREYTPITLDQFEKGYFELLIKRYPGGYFSDRIFDKMKVGDCLEFYGPVVTLNYAANVAKCIGMIAGGTGITPMYQVIRTVLKNPQDNTKIKLVYANKSTDDILLHDELRNLAETHPEQLEIRYVVEICDDNAHDYLDNDMVEGRIQANSLKDFLPGPMDDRTVIFVCGPDGMLEFLCGKGSKDGGNRGHLPNSAGTGTYMQPPLGGLLKYLGYQNHLVIRF
mmetsp:Transcript_8571/g.10104  ORF Transcript_8571/g.10104 Transcript_8571/m.10104 type:complete len:311 (-) Transcript_8571:1382-2314(-)